MKAFKGVNKGLSKCLVDLPLSEQMGPGKHLA